jgi:WD40 repeat protein
MIGGDLDLSQQIERRRSGTDGTIVDGILRLWDVNTGREIRAFNGHSQGILSVSFSRDSKCALSSSWDGTVRLWDIESGREIRSFVGTAYSVAFSPDGNFALLGSSDAIRQLDINTGREIRTFAGHARGAYSLSFLRMESMHCQVVLINP